MNNKAFFLLGLLTSCDALWQSQLSTDPTLCTQSSSLCPTGQLCDFSAGTCQPIGGTNPPGWSVSTSVNSCPQAPTIKITGPASGSVPQVKLNTLPVDPEDVKQVSDGLMVTLPRQLPAGAVQVTLTFSANQPPVILSPGFQYLTQNPVTSLVLLASPLAQLPTAPSQVAAWHPGLADTLDLAVLGGSNNSVGHYRDAATSSRQLASFTPVATVSTLSSGVTVQTNNLATASDPLNSGSQDLITAASVPGSAAFFVGGSDTPVVKTPAMTPPTFTLGRQLVAGGFFKDGGGSVQALTFIGWQSGTTQLPIKHSSSPDQKVPPVSDFLSVQTLTLNPMPLAVASGQLNSDANTDIILLAGTSTNSAAYWINGGAAPVATQFAALPTTATSVAIGNLDSNALPEAVFGINPNPSLAGQVIVYLNRSAQSTPTISWDLTNPVLIVTKLSPTALAVTDYNGDGLNDIVYAAADGVHLLLNQLGTGGTPQFTDYLVYKMPAGGAGLGASNLVAIDFSGDSRPDIILADERNHNVLLLENSCTALPSPG